LEIVEKLFECENKNKNLTRKSFLTSTSFRQQQDSQDFQELQDDKLKQQQHEKRRISHEKAPQLACRFCDFNGDGDDCSRGNECLSKPKTKLSLRSPSPIQEGWVG
jgi:hypothetical protein